MGLVQGLSSAEPGPETWLTRACLNLSFLIYEMEVMTPALSPQAVQHPATQDSASAAAAVQHHTLPARGPGPGASTDPHPTQP